MQQPTLQCETVCILFSFILLNLIISSDLPKGRHPQLPDLPLVAPHTAILGPATRPIDEELTRDADMSERVSTLSPCRDKVLTRQKGKRS